MSKPKSCNRPKGDFRQRRPLAKLQRRNAVSAAPDSAQIAPRPAASSRSAAWPVVVGPAHFEISDCSRLPFNNQLLLRQAEENDGTKRK